MSTNTTYNNEDVKLPSITELSSFHVKNDLAETHFTGDLSEDYVQERFEFGKMTLSIG
jgi:hypothetical protein